MATVADVAAAQPVPEPMLPRPLVVRWARRETADTFTMGLAPPHGGGPSFRPGQFNMLYVFGVGEVPISVSGDPADEAVLVHTIRAVGSVTRHLQRRVRGDVVGVRGPFGSAWPVEQAEGHDVVLVAGGIGLAPLRPALYHILRRRHRYGRVALLYGARTPQDVIYASELRRWRSRFDVDVQVTVDRALGDWHGAVGVVTNLVDRALVDRAAMAFVCGPEVMMRFAVLSLQRRGVGDSRIFVSMERNMECGAGLCGHCQVGPFFVCKDGPVFRYDRILPFFAVKEV
jgi:NAD(P)H-flavin reductase